MPWNKKGPVFIGRDSELTFFRQKILLSGTPSHNIISIYGGGGIGKSSLMGRFIEIARTNQCLAVRTGNLQTTPVVIMEEFAGQLGFSNKGLHDFSQAITSYKELFERLQNERELGSNLLARKSLDGEGTGENVAITAELMTDKYHSSQHLKGIDELSNLTKVFVQSLNQLAAQYSRIILCFDSFDGLAAEIIPWLQDHFLHMDINDNVVLIIAGRRSLYNTTPNLDLQQWPLDSIHSMPLNNFTEKETHSYLEAYGITDESRIKNIWRINRRPATLLKPAGYKYTAEFCCHVANPEDAVVENFLHQIPKREKVKRQLALHGALLSKPFNLDDLRAFSYINEKNIAPLYDWLIGQPFVLIQNTQYCYHEQAQSLFSFFIYRRSRTDYFDIHRQIVKCYKQQLERIEEREGENRYHSFDWLELNLALISQLFLLSSREATQEATERVLTLYEFTAQVQKVVRVLEKLLQEGELHDEMPGYTSRQIIEQLLLYTNADQKKQAQKWLEIAGELVAILNTPALQARIDVKRGFYHASLGSYDLALRDLDRAIALDTSYAEAYVHRGLTFHMQDKHSLAIKDYEQAIALNPNNAHVYVLLGNAYAALQEYKHALTALEQGLTLNPDDARGIYAAGHYLQGTQAVSGGYRRLYQGASKRAGLYRSACAAGYYLQGTQAVSGGYRRLYQGASKRAGLYRSACAAGYYLQRTQAVSGGYRRPYQDDSAQA